MALGWKQQYFRYKDFFLNISLLYKKREVRMFVEIFLSFITITFLSIFALKPTIETIVQLSKDIKTKENILAQLNVKIQALATAKDVYEQEVENISLIKYAVPDQANADILTRQIELLAGQNSVKILNFTVDKLTLIGTQTPPLSLSAEGLTDFPPGSGSVSFSITVTGDYLSLFSFQKGLENLRRPIRIDSAKIFTVVTETGNSQNLSVSGRFPYLLQILQK